MRVSEVVSVLNLDFVVFAFLGEDGLVIEEEDLPVDYLIDS